MSDARRIYAQPFELPRKDRVRQVSRRSASVGLQKTRINAARPWMIVAALVFWTALSVSYIDAISPTFAYQGLTLWNAPLSFWIVVGCLECLPALWLPYRWTRPSDLAVWILYVTSIAPVGLVALMLSPGDLSAALMLPATMVLGFLLLEVTRRGRLWNCLGPGLAPEVFAWIVIGLTLAIDVIVLILNPPHISLSLATAYDRRIAARALLGSQTLSAYTIALLRGALVPLAVVIGIVDRRTTALVAAGLGALALFALGGAKSSIALPLAVVLAIGLAAAGRGRRAGLLFLGGMALVVLAGIGEQLVFESQYVLDSFVRREFVVPSYLTIQYWIYYSTHALVLMRDSVVGRLFGLPSEISVPRLIGWEVFHNMDSNANVGIWGRGFADFGYLGVLGVSLVAGWLLRLVDSISAGKHFYFGIVLALAAGTVWTNSALHTSLLSNALLPLGLLIWAAPAALPYASAAAASGRRLRRIVATPRGRNLNAWRAGARRRVSIPE